MNSELPIPAPGAPQAKLINAETRMKPNELLLMGAVYLIAVTLAYFIVLRIDEENAVGISQGIGSIFAVYTAIWLYQSRNDVLAPVSVKVTVGATLAVLAVLQGLVFQQLLQWMNYADISIFFGAAGAFVFPFVLWNNLGKSVIQSRKPRS